MAEPEYPIDCTTVNDKMEYCIIAEEALRLAHNVMGKWYKDGVTLAEHEKLPTPWKTKYQYVSKLAKADWDKFQTEDFLPANEKTSEGRVNARVAMKKSTKWKVDPSDI